ncbi:transketolase family protein [Jannaschia sp. LMIT008]|uniref:transketolase family protein n=1 Tax=Jannaschia maritima TaxID=3032585 RepID=UPI0028123682|nr:transketolase family protein [Jannaschia sp. LMIT008]
MLDPEDKDAGRRVVEAPFAAALSRLMDARDDLCVVTADLSKWTDVLPFAKAHPDRFVQVGMAEQNLMGVTAGLAKTGLLPIAVTFGVFATRRAYDQIAMSLATRPCKAIIAGFLPGLDSRFRGTHQAIDDLAIIRSLPGVTVIDPGDATELEEAVVAAADRDGLTYVRCSRGRAEALFEPAPFRIGPPRQLADGDGGMGVVTTGAATRWVAEIRPPGVAHLHVPTLKPFPAGEVAAFALDHARVVSVENHLLHGGLGASVAQAMAARGVATPLDARGIDDRWGEYGRPEYSRDRLGLGPDALRAVLSGERVAA